ncbi:uncharacterized protein LOC132163214 [Corylus avellana]|uniref:uncharacterized protein LOC132163214 n=1 Tax=Corylus avellana TaxID=13451 RepID=UPI00286D1A81|nr:uncharacterized protein LOC132163214 [Corylus avellana]
MAYFVNLHGSIMGAPASKAFFNSEDSIFIREICFEGKGYHYTKGTRYVDSIGGCLGCRRKTKSTNFYAQGFTIHMRGGWKLAFHARVSMLYFPPRVMSLWNIYLAVDGKLIL